LFLQHAKTKLEVVTVFTVDFSQMCETNAKEHVGCALLVIILCLLFNVYCDLVACSQQSSIAYLDLQLNWCHQILK